MRKPPKQGGLSLNRASWIYLLLGRNPFRVGQPRRRSDPVHTAVPTVWAEVSKISNSGAPPGARRAGCHRPSGGKAPVRSLERVRGRSGAWAARAGACQARMPPGRPSVRRRSPTQDLGAPTRPGGTGGAPAPAVPVLWPPSAGASAAPDHPLRGWPVQGQSEPGEDQGARRKRGERSRGPRAACREAREAGGQAPRRRRGG